MSKYILNFVATLLAALGIYAYFSSRSDQTSEGAVQISVVNTPSNAVLPNKGQNIAANSNGVSFSPSTGWKVNPANPQNWEDEIVPFFVKVYIKRLRWGIQYGGSDEQWSNIAKSKLRILASQVKHTIGAPSINCNRRFCELHIEVETGLTDQERKSIIEKLAEPAYGPENRRFFTVRQIFSGSDTGESPNGFFAYYQKKVV